MWSQPRWVVNLGIAACGVLVFHLVSLSSGKVADNRGLGWDGEAYAVMVTGALSDGKPYPQSRPLPVLAARIPYALGLDLVQGFTILNYIYAFALYLAAALLLERYRAGPGVRLAIVGNIALCIGTSKMFAFYPVQIDLGALALVTAAFYLAGGNRPWLAGLACALAGASREFAAAVALYGIHRRVRLGDGWLSTALTYLPTFATLVLIRWWVAVSHPGSSAPGVLVIDDAIRNLGLWLSPAYVAVFAYFAVSVFGGVSAVLLVRGSWALRRLRAEPELATFLVVIGGLSALGNIDIWRYLVFALPAALALIGPFWHEQSPVQGRRLLVAVTLFTLLTQRPFERMDTLMYFRDWFPLYHYYGHRDPLSELIPVWAVRLTSLLLLTAALHSMARAREGAPVAALEEQAPVSR